MSSSSATSAAGAEYSSLALKSDGTVWAWGYVANGVEHNSPVQVGGLSGITAIATGDDQSGPFSAALKSDGTVWTWGLNSGGELGDGTTTDNLTPAQVPGLTGVTAIGAGYQDVMALKSDGTVWAWGTNGLGELGNGTTTDSASPVQVSGLTGVTGIATGWYHGLALKADGTVWAWGDNRWGQLGIGSTTESLTPVQVTSARIIAIAAGAEHSAAVAIDGTAWEWGNNADGELGDGTTSGPQQCVVVFISTPTTYACSTTPVEVCAAGQTAPCSNAFAGTMTIAAGNGHTLGLRSDGTVWAWGLNGRGELGNGTTGGSSSPVQTSNLTAVTEIAAGANHSLAVRADGSLWEWGWNGNGQLGNGTTTNSNLPIQVFAGAAQAPLPQPPTSGPSASEQYGGSNPGLAAPPPCSAGDPVECATGNFYESLTDLAVPGRGRALNLSRTYNALAASGAASSGPMGYGWSGSYHMQLTVNPVSQAVTVTQENGSTVTFTPSGAAYTASAYVIATLVHNADGTFTYTLPDQRRDVFSATGQLLQETDRNGYATTLAYTGGNMTSVTDPAGRTLTLSYDAGGRVLSAADPAGRTVAYQYDAGGNLVKVTDIGGGVTQYAYDGSHRLLTTTAPDGGVTTNVYDGAGRVTSQTDPMGRITRFGYSGSTTTVTDPRGMVTEERFQYGLPTFVTRGVGTALAATWRYGYDAGDNVDLVLDPIGHYWRSTYDSRGNRLTSTDLLHRTVTATYDGTNDPITVTDPSGVTTTNAFDGNGNLLSTSTPLTGTSQTSTRTFANDPTHPGDVTSITDAGSNTWHLGYDADGDLTRTQDPAGDVTTRAYDGVGRLLSSVSPKGNLPGAIAALFTTSEAVNAFGQPTAVTDPLGNVTRYGYDARRNLASVTDPTGAVTSYVRDLDGEVTAANRPDGSRLQSAYDADGNQVSSTDGLNHVTGYTFDLLNRLTATTDPLNRTTSFLYDAAGNRTAAIDAMGRTTAYSYDAANELISIGYSDGVTPGVSLTYDALGRRSSMTDGTGTTAYAYDSLGRMTGTTSSFTVAGMTGLTSASVGYQYDLRGLMTGITYPSGSSVHRGYDAAGRLTSVGDWLGNTSTFAYDTDSNLVTENLANGTVGTLAYDDNDGLTRIDHSRGSVTFLDLAYTRDGDRRLSSSAASGVTTDSAQSYAYDPSSRLTGYSHGLLGTQGSFGYDAGDDLVSAGQSQGISIQAPVCNCPLISLGAAGTTSLTYDPAGELTEVKSTAGAGVSVLGQPVVGQGPVTLQHFSLSYDLDGNRTAAKDLLTGAAVTYSYDQANRLSSFNGAVQYGYNGDGLRIYKAVNASATQETWDVAEGLPLLIGDGTSSYVTGPGGLPLEQILADHTVRFYHQDQLGSTRALTDQNGAIVATYSYTPFGDTLTASGSVPNPLLYAGQYRDAESGLYYLRARYFDPGTAQFLSRDPAVAMSRQAYSYATDNPLNSTDPSGLCDWWNPFCGGSPAQHVTIGGIFSGVVSSISQGTRVAYGYVGGVLTGGARELAAGAGAGALFGGIAQAIEDLSLNLSPAKRIARTLISAAVGGVVAAVVVAGCEAISAGLATPGCVVVGAFILGTLYDATSDWLFNQVGLGADPASGSGGRGSASSGYLSGVAGAFC